jgi:hypothetical protein
MKTIGTLIQALLLATVAVYVIPYLVAAVKELLHDYEEENN